MRSKWLVCSYNTFIFAARKIRIHRLFLNNTACISPWRSKKRKRRQWTHFSLHHSLLQPQILQHSNINSIHLRRQPITLHATKAATQKIPAVNQANRLARNIEHLIHIRVDPWTFPPPHPGFAKPPRWTHLQLPAIFRPRDEPCEPK